MSAHKPFNRRPANMSASRDDQVIELLNALGQRLIASERERESLKRTLAELEARTNQAADRFQALQDRQGRIETAQRAQAEKVEKAAAMADRIEEAILQQGRMNRRLEKMHTERVQMIRKLERIEETVIETQEVLHSKALTLMGGGDFSALAGGGAGDTPRHDGAIVAPNADDGEERGFWAQAHVLRHLVTAAVLACAVVAGWMVYSGTDRGEKIAAATPAPAAVQMASAGRTAEMPMPASITAPVAEDIAPPARASDIAQNNDILHADDATLLAQFDEDPDALAAQLNAIEPAAAPPPDDVAVRDTPETEKPAPVAAAPAGTPPVVKMGSGGSLLKEQADAFLAQQKALQKGKLSDRIQPDPGLPPVVKEIEDKAFENVAEAQHDLAAIYTAGHGGVKTDYGRAAAWFTEAALQGIGNARYNLGVLYHQGLGVPKDLGKAIGWYRAAALLNHPEAQYNLGIAYIEGIGSPYDPQAAATFFENAARAGIMEAAYNLGLIYENGLLGEVRSDKALYWYKQAAERGSPEAQAAMDQLAKTLGLKKNDIDAFIGRAPAAPPSASAPAPVKKSKVESLRPEDKVDINEVASYIPQVSPATLHKTQKIDADPGKYRAITAQVQEQLMRLGLYPGPADGISGPQTEDAIRSYQRANKLKTDGRASEALLVHLLTNEMDASTLPGNNPDEYGSRIE